MKLLRNIFYSFPVQLLLQHFKKHQILLFFWLLLFAMITSNFGTRMGIPYLFLDPEYMGKVSFYSFFIVGFATGGFIMIWQITSYILHSWRFPFLAAVREPFLKFNLNNSVIPFIYIVVNVIEIISFQTQSEKKTGFELLVLIEGYLSGLFLIIMITNTYFFSTNRNVLSWIKKEQIRKKTIKASRLQWGTTFESDNEHEVNAVRVDYYFSSPIHIRLTRNVEHYSKMVLQSVYRQHYFNSLFIEITTIFILIGLSSLIDYPFFRIPASASVLLLFAVISILVGAFSYWLRGWRTTVFIVLFVVLNFFSKVDSLKYKNQVFGLNYANQLVRYDSIHLSKMCDSTKQAQDKAQTLVTLNQWLANQKPGKKPYFICINVSGGGSRSALWTFTVLQKLDSLLNGQLMRQTVLITGASGGMLGAAYFRELYMRNKDRSSELQNKQYNANIAADLLHAVTTSIAVNDMFIPWLNFKYAGQTYKKDRAYAFEQQFNDNTKGILNKRLLQYREPERNAEIPWMIINGTIVNDGRILMISPQPISYLCKPNYENQKLQQPKIDAVDFTAFFHQQNADSVSFMSALRINCTFPFVLPNVSLPTIPQLEVMDAGIRDNYGFETSTRFISAFKEWIQQNTAGVLMIQITDFNRTNISLENNEQSPAAQLSNPVTNVFYNFPEFQYYHQNDLLNLLDQSLSNNLHLYRFEYTPKVGGNRASLSFHLTYQEKSSIIEAAENEENKRFFAEIKNLLQQ